MKKILVADDDDLIRSIISARLKGEYQVTTANNGEEALQKARADKPDLLIVDLLMPRMHGYAVVQEIRADEKLKDIKIIVSSAKAYPVDMKTAKDLGADLYITKPFDVNELAARVGELLSAGLDVPVTVRFWGTRGSIATPGPGTTKYGGNTACTEIRYKDKIIILDTGTGARELGLALMQEFRGKPIEAHIFIGHTHWDHIQGFPFFTPAYVPGNRLTIYSVRGAGKSLEKVFTGQMDANYFPVALGDMLARLKFVELDGDVVIDGLTVSYTYLNHPGLAIGFRVTAGRKSVVYVSDNEPYRRVTRENEFTEKLDMEIVEFARGADLFICEAQYTDEEYQHKRGWGHSSIGDALQLALMAGVKRLALFHHDPMHNDEFIDEVVGQCEKKIVERGANLVCFAAAEGLTVSL